VVGQTEVQDLFREGEPDKSQEAGSLLLLFRRFSAAAMAKIHETPRV